MSDQAHHSQKSAGSFSPTALALLSLSALWCVVWLIHSWHYWEDDSFIHLEFARSLASGRGFAFNGHVVYGDTAPLWVMLLVAFHSLIPNWILAGKVLSIIGTLFALTGVYAFSRRLSSDKNFPALMVLVFVVNPYFCYWSFSGMETLTAAGLALWTTILATSDLLSEKRFFLACLLAGAAPLLRPELSFFTLIVGILLLYRRFIDSRSEYNSLLRLSNLTRLAAAIALLSGPALAWAAYALHTFGRIIPNTNAAKRAPPGDSVIFRLLNVYSFGYPAILLALLAGIIYLARNTATRKNALTAIRNATIFARGGWLLALWTAISLVFYVANHTYVQTRYILVSAVGLTIVALAGLRAVSLPIFRLCLALSLFSTTLLSVLPAWLLIRNKVAFVAAVHEQARFIHDQLPPEALVADYNIGEVAFFSEHPILDTGGITRPGAIPYLNAPLPTQLAWVHSQDGAYLVFDKQPEPGAVLVHSLPIPYIGWSLNPRRYDDTGPLNIWKLAPATPENTIIPESPSSNRE